MTFPIHPDQLDQPSLLTAQDIVAYRRRLGRMPKVPNLEAVLLCLERGLPERMKRRFPVELAGKMNGELYALKKTGGRVAVMTNFGGGSPIVAELAEEFIAMGARRLLLMTWGGGLQTDLKAGDVVVCSQAVRDEGASYHYLPPARYVQPDSELTACLVSTLLRQSIVPVQGPTWTTDAPYRETLAEVQTYQAEGVQTVEMEAAALFAVGQARHVQTGAAVVVMDSLATYQWKVPERLDAIQRSLESLYTAAIEALAG